MGRQAVSTDGAPRPQGAYSQGVVANGFLFTAGCSPHDPRTGLIVGDTVAAQTDQVLTNLEAVLAVHGLGLGDVVKTTVHLANVERDFAAYNAAYAARFAEPYPARTTVGSTLPGILVEIDVVAALRQ